MRASDEAVQLDEDMWQRLEGARNDYSANVPEVYDEVLHQVAARIDSSLSIGKLDVGGLVLWKRLRADTPWVSDLMGWSDEAVRKVTAAAVTAVRDESLAIPDAAAAGRAALVSLPGFGRGDALASALLTAACPTRMAVYDRRTDFALQNGLGVALSAARGRYGRYLRLLSDLAAQARGRGLHWTPRDVDLALYWLGRP